MGVERRDKGSALFHIRLNRGITNDNEWIVIIWVPSFRGFRWNFKIAFLFFDDIPLSKTEKPQTD